MENKYEEGGLGLPNIAVKGDSLLITQMCRILSMSGDKTFQMPGY